MQDDDARRINRIRALPVELVLDQYLAAFEQYFNESVSSSNAGSSTDIQAAAASVTAAPTEDRVKLLAKDLQHNKQDEILRVVDFLYGNTLEGALSILDAAETSGSITQVVSIPSQRSLYLVKGSASYKRRGHKHGGGGGFDNSMTTVMKNSAYLCILPRPTDDLPIYYCSCRSFLERSRSSRAGEASCLCKHLLAIRLMKVLGTKPLRQETMSDAEFASSIVQCMAID